MFISQKIRWEITLIASSDFRKAYPVEKLDEFKGQITFLMKTKFCILIIVVLIDGEKI